MSPVPVSSLPGLWQFCRIRTFLEMLCSLFIVQSPRDTAEGGMTLSLVCWILEIPVYCTGHLFPTASTVKGEMHILSTIPHCFRSNPSVCTFVTFFPSMISWEKCWSYRRGTMWLIPTFLGMDLSPTPLSSQSFLPFHDLLGALAY